MMKSAYKNASWTFLLGVMTIAGCSDDGGDDDNNATGGSGGMGGAPACVGDPPVTVHNVCADIPSEKKGDAGFAITSPDYEFCEEMPANLTCDGKDFGTGVSPTYSWTGAPAGTLSFAAVFKDISILADKNPATEKFGYHWVMWDIPATTTGLPGGMKGGFHSEEVPGALQWSSLGSYGYFTPCPNPFPREAPMFACSLVTDSYSFTLYALPVEKLDNLPAPDMDPATGMPAGNWVVKMAHYIESLDAIAIAEYRGTSKAWAKAFVPPNAAQFPCTGGNTEDCLK